MRYETVKKFAADLGADRLMLNMWKHREKVPYAWQEKIVRSSKGKVRFDDFWEIDWVKEKSE